MLKKVNNFKTLRISSGFVFFAEPSGIELARIRVELWIVVDRRNRNEDDILLLEGDAGSRNLARIGFGSVLFRKKIVSCENAKLIIVVDDLM